MRNHRHPFYKHYGQNTLIYPLVTIYLLNITDIFFTKSLLKTGLYSEANPFMAPVVQGCLSSIMVKILLPGVLLFYVFIRMKTATPKQWVRTSYCINGLLIIYVLINAMHIINFSLFPLLSSL